MPSKKQAVARPGQKEIDGQTFIADLRKALSEVRNYEHFVRTKKRFEKTRAQYYKNFGVKI